MRLSSWLLAAASVLLFVDSAAAQWGRPYGGYYNRPYYGVGVGVGVGVPGYYGYSPYYYSGYRNRGYYYGPNGYSYGPTTYTVPNAVYPPTTSFYEPTAVAPTPAPINAQMGLQIIDVFEGPAKKANMRSGDIITAVGATRTQTFEDLQQALARSKGDVEVSFVNSANSKTERTKVTPDAGKIGIAVVPVYLP